MYEVHVHYGVHETCDAIMVNRSETEMSLYMYFLKLLISTNCYKLVNSFYL